MNMMLSAAAVTAAAGAVVAEAKQTDPVFAAIDAHRAALAVVRREEAVRLDWLARAEAIVGPRSITMLDYRSAASDGYAGPPVSDVCMDHQIDVLCPPEGRFAEENAFYKRCLVEQRAAYDAAFKSMRGDRDIDEEFNAYCLC